MIKVVFSLLCCALTFILHGQSITEIILSGIILDSETMEPLPYAHVVLNSTQGTKPNSDGSFSLRLNDEDTITISHVGYRSERKIVEIPEDGKNLSLAVFLIKDLTLLDPVEITPMPATEAGFKQAILEMDVGPKLTSKIEEQHGQITFDMILGPKVSYDAYENYRGIGQSRGISLFSTGPNKGILRAIKNFKSRKKRKK